MTLSGLDRCSPGCFWRRWRVSPCRSARTLGAGWNILKSRQLDIEVQHTVDGLRRGGALFPAIALVLVPRGRGSATPGDHRDPRVSWRAASMFLVVDPGVGGRHARLEGRGSLVPLRDAPRIDTHLAGRRWPAGRARPPGARPGWAPSGVLSRARFRPWRP